MPPFVPGIPHSAARLGSGSEVLGFDTPRPAGHARGPRLQLFLHRRDVSRHAGRVRHILAAHLPKTFHGHPVRHGRSHPHRGLVHHRARLHARPGPHPRRLARHPTQLLAEVTAGAVFHDGLRELTPIRHALRWYPHDIWLHVLACQWRRISRELPLVARCGGVGDELGSAVAAARLVRLRRLTRASRTCTTSSN